MVYIPDGLNAEYLYKLLTELANAWTVDLAENSLMLFEVEPETDPEPYLKFLKEQRYINTGEVRVSGIDYKYFGITDQGFRYLERLFADLYS